MSILWKAHVVLVANRSWMLIYNEQTHTSVYGCASSALHLQLLYAAVPCFTPTHESLHPSLVLAEVEALIPMYGQLTKM